MWQVAHRTQSQWGVPHRTQSHSQSPQPQPQPQPQPSAVPSRSLSMTGGPSAAAAAAAAVPGERGSQETAQTSAQGQGNRERVRRVSVSDMMVGGIVAGLTSLG